MVMYSVYKGDDLVYYGPGEKAAFAAARKYNGSPLREEEGGFSIWGRSTKRWISMRSATEETFAVRRPQPEIRIPRTAEEAENTLILQRTMFPADNDIIRWAQTDRVIWKKITRCTPPWGVFYVGKLIDGRLLKAPSLRELRYAAMDYAYRLRSMPYEYILAARAASAGEDA